MIGPGSKVMVDGREAVVEKLVGSGDVLARLPDGSRVAVGPRQYKPVGGPAAPVPGMIAKGAGTAERAAEPPPVIAAEAPTAETVTEPVAPETGVAEPATTSADANPGDEAPDSP